MITQTDWQALCSRLLVALKAWSPHGGGPLEGAEKEYEAALIAEADAALAKPEPDASQLSDGYHTFAELYEHRHALCLALMRSMPQHWWFSRRHADGELCFGGNDWFVVGAELSDVGSVTYHLPSNLYPVAQSTGAAELEKGRPWDGHTATDVVSRLRDWAAQPEPVGPTDEELMGLDDLENAWNAQADAANSWDELGIDEIVWFAQRQALTRWGRPAIEPVPTPEPGVADHITDDEGHRWDRTMDAALWAKAFCLICPEMASREDVMIGWFANAIMAGCDHQAWKMDAERKPVPVAERLPEPGVKVLAHYFNSHGKSRTVCARWIPARFESRDFEPDDLLEYDEDSNIFYWPEGWYEVIENWDDYECVTINEGEVTHWQPLPHWALPVPTPDNITTDTP